MICAVELHIDQAPYVPVEAFLATPSHAEAERPQTSPKRLPRAVPLLRTSEVATHDKEFIIQLQAASLGGGGRGVATAIQVDPVAGQDRAVFDGV